MSKTNKTFKWGGKFGIALANKWTTLVLTKEILLVKEILENLKQSIKTYLIAQAYLLKIYS